jgi:alpha-D-ribose 1-methylphosphonate 5-triphosphate diphosphatase
VRVPYISLNDHSPGQGQYRDVERLITMATESQAARNGKAADPEWYRERMRTAQADGETVPAFYRSVAGQMAALPMILSTHDDDTIGKVDQQLVLGATISEFPVTFEAAQHARDHGMTIIVGAPNVVRGGSQSGNLSATDLIAAGLADAICADYHAPCLAPSAFRLWQQGVLDLPAAIRMITLNPARAVGLHDRGEIALGKIADLAIVRLDNEGWPHVEATIVGGRSAFHFARFPEVPMPQPMSVNTDHSRELQEQAV